MKSSSDNSAGRVSAISRWPFAVVGCFSFAISLLTLTVPLYMLHVYDHVLTSYSGSTLFFLTLLAAGLLLALGFIDMFRSRLLVRLSTRWDCQFAERIFAAAVAERLRGNSRTSVQVLQDLDILRGFVSGSALPALFDAPWAPIFIGVIFLLHPLLGAVALTGAVVLLIVALGNEAASRRLLRLANEHAMGAAGFAESALRNAETIEAMGMAPAIIRHWREKRQRAIDAHAAVADRAVNFMTAAKFWRLFLQVIMLATGAALAIENVVTPGVMVAASIIMSRALAPIEGVAASWRALATAGGVYKRLRAMLAQGGDKPTRMSLPDVRGAMLVANLFVSPPGSVKPVLKGISFTLRPGEALGIIGPSASGKSALARALVGAWPAVSGEIRLDGASLADHDRVRLGRQIGYLPQDVQLFDGTVADNIVRFGDPDPEGVIAAAQLVGLHELILRLPQAYDTPLGPAGEPLSAGQRQRIALARAVYGKPTLVVLDEPNAHLDAEGEDALVNAITALREQGSTVIIITHKPTLVTMVDRILVLREGTVEMLGPRTEVLAKFTRPVSTPRDTTPPVARVGTR